MKCDKCGTEWDAPVNDCPVCESGYCCVEYAQKFIRQRDEAVTLLRSVVEQYEKVRSAEGYPTADSVSTREARAFLSSLDGVKR